MAQHLLCGVAWCGVISPIHPPRRTAQHTLAKLMRQLPMVSSEPTSESLMVICATCTGHHASMLMQAQQGQGHSAPCTPCLPFAGKALPLKAALLRAHAGHPGRPKGGAQCKPSHLAVVLVDHLQGSCMPEQVTPRESGTSMRRLGREAEAAVLRHGSTSLACR